MSLNTDQTAAFHAVQSGQSIFLTGPAGSGKSFLIRHIQEWAEINGKPITVTALTGCASILLGTKAKTLHSWAGIGLGRESADQLVSFILKHPKAKSRWKKTQILVIDEISMMPPELFEKLDIIGKRIRASSKPWGGIQLILCGDFFQLPPVVKGISGETMIGRFAFESAAWKALNPKPVLLNTIERQTDAGFQRLLNECRIGAPSPETITLLKSRQNLNWKDQLIRPTLLFSRNADVDTINEKNIAALKKPVRIFEAKTVIAAVPDDPTLEIPTGELLDRYVQRLDNDANYCPRLELCEGCQVMLLVNKDLEAGLANGSRGVVIGYRDDGMPIVQFKHGDPVAIEHHTWTSNDSPTLQRHQIPLRVAYAVTIHKSQGATLDCALVDIGSSTFEYGQAYVALSRVRDLESLYVWNLEPSKIIAHPKVVEYYMQLHEAATAPAPPPTLPAPLVGFGADLEDEGWRTVVTAWAATPTGTSCLQQYVERCASAIVYPKREHILNAIKYTSLRAVKVVILGQDPYHGPDQAHGLSFSILPGNPLPPSLKNIRKELVADLGLGEGVWPPAVGDLSQWARQGVLLLNTVLTVEEHNPKSHAGIGWEDLTSRLLGAVLAAHADDPLVFLAWGKDAQTLIHKLRLGPKHKILSAAHPSPLSAHTGFFGSKPFSTTNTLLTGAGASPVVWTLTAPSSSPEDPTGV
jgi:ATP-dependent DNA helicase PIF1